MEIEVIDELMGNGKTTTVLRYIENDHIQTGKKWLYCTEYLNELRTRTEENELKSKLVYGRSRR